MAGVSCDGMRCVLRVRRSYHGLSAFVGLDVHSEHTFATVLDGDGRLVAQRKIENEKIPSFLKLFQVEKVGVEASTHVTPLYRALQREGYQVLVSHPKKTRERYISYLLIGALSVNQSQ